MRPHRRRSRVEDAGEKVSSNSSFHGYAVFRVESLRFVYARRYEIIPLTAGSNIRFVAWYDYLFGDLAVGGFRRLDAVRGRVAERRCRRNTRVVDAGLQVSAVGRLVLVVGVVGLMPAFLRARS